MTTQKLSNISESEQISYNRSYDRKYVILSKRRVHDVNVWLLDFQVELALQVSCYPIVFHTRGLFNIDPSQCKKILQLKYILIIEISLLAIDLNCLLQIHEHSDIQSMFSKKFKHHSSENTELQLKISSIYSNTKLFSCQCSDISMFSRLQLPNYELHNSSLFLFRQLAAFTASFSLNIIYFQWIVIWIEFK